MGGLSAPVIFVRHAAPEQSGTDAARWGLSRRGWRAAGELAGRLDPGPGASLTMSPEPKARSTAAALGSARGLAAVVDERLAEAGRAWVPDGYAEVAARWLSGDSVDGWEERRAEVQRIGDAVARARGTGDAVAVLVSHGLAITAFLARKVAGLAAIEFWTGLDMPDAWAWDPGSGELRRP